MSLILSGTDGLSDVDGSAATPAIRGTDANTGIFFPAADTIAFAEGGAEVARFDSSGNFGVGTTSPLGKIHVTDASATNGALFERTTATTTGPRISSRSLATSSGDMADTFGPTHAFAIQDTAAVINPIAEIGAARNGADNTGNLIFRTYSAGTATTNMTLDSSGNLGIGTTSPTAKVHSAINSLTFPSIIASNASDYDQFQIRQPTRGGNFGWSCSGATSENYVVIDRQRSDQVLEIHGTTNHIWNISNAEKMRIDSSGNLLVGTTSQILSNTKFNFSSSQATALGGMGFVNTVAPSIKWQIGPDAAGNFVVFNGSAVGVYVANGGTAWTAYSDERLKTTIIPFENASAKVATLRAGTGRYLKDAEGTSRSFLIAQDVLKVLPEAVDANNPDALGLSYTDVIPLLVAAINEQQALITTLTDRIAALENK